MGGEVAIAICKKGKITTRIARKNVAAQVSRPDFFKRPLGVIDEYGGVPTAIFAPYHYGLVFVDFDSKIIISNQNYSEPTSYRFDKGPLCEDHLRIFFNEGRIVEIEGGPRFLPRPSEKGNFGAWCRRIEPFINESYGQIQLIVAPPAGWVVHDFYPYGENMDHLKSASWESVIAQLENQGITLSQAQLTAWREFMASQDLDEGPIQARQQHGELESNVLPAPSPRMRSRI